jgi:hypothetical protein
MCIILGKHGELPMARLIIEFILARRVLHPVKWFDGTVEEAAVAAAADLDAYNATMAQIVDQETGEELKVIAKS